MPSELLKQKWKEYVNSPEAKAWRKRWKEYWEYNALVPPQVFDFLRTIQADLGADPKLPQNYTIYTRKAKGSEFSNPSFNVDKKMFKAIKVVIHNLKSSVIVPSPEIRFFKDTGELRIWGFPRGGVEENEEDITAAKREVLEEVGLEEFDSIEELGIYDRYPSGITEDTPGAYPMEIHMFLFKTNDTGPLNPRDKSVKEAGWFSYEGALEKLTDEKDRQFLQNHLEKISESQAKWLLSTKHN